MARRRALPAPDERIGALGIEALECRDLRHSWPRHGDKRRRMVPIRTVGGRVRVAERHMECVGGCGAVAVDEFEYLPDGRRIRVGKRRLKYTKPYLLKRADPQAARVSAEEIGFAVTARLYPDLLG